MCRLGFILVLLTSFSSIANNQTVFETKKTPRQIAGITTGSIAGSIGAVLSVPQTIKTFRFKDSTGVSVTMLSLIFGMDVLWVVYGSLMFNYEILATAAAGCFFQGLGIVTALFYRNGRVVPQPQEL